MYYQLILRIESFEKFLIYLIFLFDYQRKYHKLMGNCSINALLGKNEHTIIWRRRKNNSHDTYDKQTHAEWEIPLRRDKNNIRKSTTTPTSNTYYYYYYYSTTTNVRRYDTYPQYEWPHTRREIKITRTGGTHTPTW